MIVWPSLLGCVIVTPVEVAEVTLRRACNDKLYNIEIPAIPFRFCRRHQALDAADIAHSVARPLARPSASASSRSVVFCTRNDVMRITTLNQIFWMLAVTAGAAAYSAAAYDHPCARPACGYYPYPPCY
jgi:hypothetical protein